MRKSVALLLVLVFLMASNTVIAEPASSDESASNTLFSDHFDGEQIDDAKWLVQDNLDNSGYPAFGASASVANSHLCLKSSGSTFPSVTCKINPFPATGDFAISFGLNYTSIGWGGNGVWISQGPFIKSDFLTTANILEVWADTEALTTSGYVRAYLLGNIVYRDIVYVQSYSTSRALTVKLEYSKGYYTLYIDGTEIASAPSQLRPDNLGLGHPECLFLPVPPQDVDVNKPWGALEIDYVKMLSQAELSFSTFTESTQIGSKINIAGTLNDFNGNPLAEQTVILSYLVPGYPTWTPITSTQTDSNGTFSESWIAAATGRFVIKAQWNGNENYASTSTCKNVSVLYDGNENIFSAESNSTLSLLAFNSSSKEISFNVEGPSGTSGYVKFQISKQLMPNMDGVKILIDGKDARCEIISQDKVWVLTFYYSHSTHNIIIKLQGVQIPEFIKALEFSDFNFLPLIIVFSISVVVVAVGFVYYRRKSNH